MIEIARHEIVGHTNHDWALRFDTSQVSNHTPIEIHLDMIDERFNIFPTGADSARSEQAFSDDGGKTWETNWINTYARQREDSKAQ
jgi:hypothetical protein